MCSGVCVCGGGEEDGGGREGEKGGGEEGEQLEEVGSLPHYVSPGNPAQDIRLVVSTFTC